MELTVRALPGPYDPQRGPFTVATPSCFGCCCCCCCCLNTLGAAAGVAAGAAHEAAVRKGRRALVPTLLGFLTVLVGFGVAWLTVRAQDPDDLGPAASTGIVAAAVVAIVALRSAGVGWSMSLGLVAAVALVGAVLFFFELALALATSGWILLATPLSLWAGWTLGRSIMRRRAGSGS